MDLSAFKTINLYLPSGNPTGLRVAEQTTSIVRVIELPRLLFNEFQDREDSNQSGIYLLFDSDEQSVYIGQSSNIAERLKQHHANGSKDWDRAVAVVSMTDNLTVSHTLQLEKIAISKAKEAKRYKLTNSTAGNTSTVSQSLLADCYQLFEIASLLISTLGYQIFDKIDIEKKDQIENDIFYCTRRDANASGVLTSEGFLIFQGSYLASEPVQSFKKWSADYLLELIRNGVIVESKKGKYFAEEFLFKSPSAAAQIVCQSPANGWTEFKNRDGVTLSEKYRG